MPMLLRSLLLCLLLAAAATATTTAAVESDASRLLLLAVGDVSRTSARVLVDAPRPASDALHLRVLRSAASADGADAAALVLDRELVMDMSLGDVERPRALQLDQLWPSTRYVVEFRWHKAGGEGVTDEELSVDRVRFRTAPDAADEGREAARVLVVSCDRFVDDGDDALWLQLARDAEQSETHFGVAHIGDQVYADAGAARVPEQPLLLSATGDAAAVGARFRRLLTAFRGIYRSTFGRPALQRVLRLGAHWMLPDDHEVANNLNRERAARAFRGWADPSRPSAERALLFERSLHYRAGLQVFYEFQYQLQRDVPWPALDFLAQPLADILRALPLHFSARAGPLRLFFLDARFDRAFLPDGAVAEGQLVGPAQRAALAAELRQWRQDRGAGVVPVVLSNLPLFFHSSLSAAIAWAVEEETYPGLPALRPGLQDLFELLIAPASGAAPPVRLLVGGDVHTLAHSRVCDASGGRCVDQLVTSGATRGSTAVEDAKLLPFYALIARLTPAADWASAVLAPLAPPRLAAWASALVGRAPWRVTFGRVFLGRNYGVLEVKRGGEFEWRETVVVPHIGTRQQLVQALFDATASPRQLALVLALLAPLALLCVARTARWAARRLQRKPKRE